ncbi:bifunctional MaoC family dehydratase N-terminal/OB-fold nucleic acid binding domain-containing protein [Cryptosporangium phraense]|uniref:DNA-binding protein n=1 Tax=Cryptosporangium phraense TaxID=2593070 RepID=A0A545B0I9_9ACTN|nr:bifunctional MaoC family dehydratase N-terminal/OB-fold nucleic acid binding domain-containing protein [Cryptosporangium phraense]TQS47097.1 DNA-binding protein [Cryptosporangium phraense]
MTDILAAAEEIRARGESEPFVARDPVNVPTMHAWLDALGDANPVYVSPEAATAAGHPGIVAPPAMIQVWTMPGLGRVRDADDPLWLMLTALTEAGYPSIVATDCDQTYHRYLEPGELVSVRSRLGEVTGPKQTALGEGWFVTTHNTWYVDDEPVAEMAWRVLKFKPRAAAPSPVLRPVISRDTEFFWAGTAANELRIQRCGECGALRHPPGPFCLSCGSDAVGFVVSGGRGTVFSYVVHHHPPVPGRAAPYVVALVELEEGVRMLGEVVDDVRIGTPVEVFWQKIDDSLTLPAWRAR